MLAAVKKAMKTLHYEASPPDVFIRCPIEPRVSHPLTAEQKTWLPKSAGIMYSFFLLCSISSMVTGMTYSFVFFFVVPN